VTGRLPIGLVGARGHTGAELVRLLDAHPRLRLAYASSRQAAGQRLDDVVPGTRTGLVVEDLAPADLASRAVRAVVLALPNGEAARWLPSIPDDVVVVDLSADHRFDAAWRYGLPELQERASDSSTGATDSAQPMSATRIAASRSTRIANPGCYATGAQLALAPLFAHDLVDGAPHVFGVSGYSGAGTTPSPNNDPERLRDNVVPYAVVDHTHEREISRHLGRDVFFTPHVAPFFRGIVLTVSAPLRTAGAPGASTEVTPTVDGLRRMFEAFYADEPLVRVVPEVPLPRDAVGRHDVTIGGLALDPRGRRAVIVATLDNLLKGAATQAVQNLNLALGLDVLDGIPVPPRGPARA
jgi:N-acetyl-gamma-glutamyl-phosphate reductase